MPDRATATPNGTSRARLRIACDDRRKGEDGRWVTTATTWVTVTAWRQLADHCTHLAKGDEVVIIGRLRQSDWKGDDQITRTGYEVDADTIGPSLRWQPATVHRATTGTPTPDADPWATTDDTEAPF